MTTKAIGYVRVSTDKQADRGVSLEAQVEKIEAMCIVQDVELLDVLVDAGESVKDLDRPGMVRILEMVQSRAVGMVIVAKLDRLTRSVKDLAVLLEQFQRRGVSLVSVAESLDTGSASGRLVLNPKFLTGSDGILLIRRGIIQSSVSNYWQQGEQRIGLGLQRSRLWHLLKAWGGFFRFQPVGHACSTG